METTGSKIIAPKWVSSWQPTDRLEQEFHHHCTSQQLIDQTLGQGDNFLCDLGALSSAKGENTGLYAEKEKIRRKWGSWELQQTGEEDWERQQWVRKKRRHETNKRSKMP